MGAVLIVLHFTQTTNAARGETLWSNGAAKSAPTPRAAPMPMTAHQPAKPEHWCEAHNATSQRQ